MLFLELKFAVLHQNHRVLEDSECYTHTRTVICDEI